MIDVIKQDITTLEIDAIVNAANETLLGGGGVDGAIQRAAGPRLLEFCRNLGGCPVGEARITPGFSLPVNWVIHTVGPVWQGGDSDEALLLERCYENSFRLALEYGVRSIAFPSISTGVYGYPFGEAAQIAVSVMQRHEKQFERIVACCFSRSDAGYYGKLLASGA
ncbi:O-acetyl-ADP-ribose deacetylase (regulator of RNase III) [Thiogranum longum]|uniref:O-acetyl-ADP-ribose deacetylase (Regulator of RNase III) n=1 Tax=Thiogranum longum TaxID=1537524 RepID=A0A4R1HB72_9GAMM|nr:O-acetyl-ADP-ribose deacetylase [Thiogranum longum]TCK19204.1 O-acetyl-ADP-ribose deacetylase (regulator of RNase III) [Thiogranum longum]